MKEAPVLLGKLDSPAVRPPRVKLGAEEIRRIRPCLVSAGLIATEAGCKKFLETHGAEHMVNEPYGFAVGFRTLEKLMEDFLADVDRLTGGNDEKA